MPLLFSYGTLRQPEVQTELFGEVVASSPDTLQGWVERNVAILDPEVVRLSGLAVHPALVPGVGPPIAGLTLELSDAQLSASDRYEVSDYRRVEVRLGSGRRAFAYVSAAHSR